MGAMLQAAIRWCLVGLLVTFHLPIPGVSGPAVAGSGGGRAACCAPKACCTADHACAGGGACAVLGLAADSSPGATDASAPAPRLAAASCHPETARVGPAPSLDPIVFSTLADPRGDAFSGRSGPVRSFHPASLPSSPQVPPPRV
jgi:hypothetical protein